MLHDLMLLNAKTTDEIYVVFVTLMCNRNIIYRFRTISLNIHFHFSVVKGAVHFTLSVFCRSSEKGLYSVFLIVKKKTRDFSLYKTF